MNRFYAHAEAGEPAVHLNDSNPARPFVVVQFGEDWDFTSRDADWCRRVADTWATAAELLQPGAAARRQHENARQAETDLEAGQ